MSIAMSSTFVLADRNTSCSSTSGVASRFVLFSGTRGEENAQRMQGQRYDFASRSPFRQKSREESAERFGQCVRVEGLAMSIDFDWAEGRRRHLADRDFVLAHIDADRSAWDNFPSSAFTVFVSAGRLLGKMPRQFRSAQDVLRALSPQHYKHTSGNESSRNIARRFRDVFHARVIFVSIMRSYKKTVGGRISTAHCVDSRGR